MTEGKDLGRAVSLRDDPGFVEQGDGVSSRRRELAYVPRTRPDIVVVTSAELDHQMAERAEVPQRIDIHYQDIPSQSNGNATERRFFLPSGEGILLGGDDFIFVDLLMHAHQHEGRGVDINTLANAAQNNKGDMDYLGKRMVVLKRIFDAYDPTNEDGVLQVIRRHLKTTPVGQSRRIRRFAENVRFVQRQG